MFETKNELDIEMARLEVLEGRIGSEQLPSEDLELLKELVQGHAERTRAAWAQERLERAVDLMFPNYNSRLPDESKPVRWPAKSWWWNGASITDCDELANGDMAVTLRSYVGGGEYDDLNGLVIPKAWIEADDIAATIHEACRIEKARVEGLAQAEKLANARREVERASAQLRALTGAANA